MEGDNLLRHSFSAEKLPADSSKTSSLLSQSADEVSENSSSSPTVSDDVEMKDFKSEEGDEKDECVSMCYEEAMAKYGTGLYQLFLFILLSVVTFSTVYNNNGYIFIGANQEHVCEVPPSTNWTDGNNETALLVYSADTCTYNTYAQYGDGLYINATKVLLEENIKCNNWVYDQSEFQLTIMSEWNINSCGGKWKIAVANSFYMLGFLIGCIVLADLADRYGRSKLLLISNVCMVISGVIASFSVNYAMLVVMRLVLGIFTAGARNAAYIYVCEVMKHRGAAGLLHGVVYCIGGITVTGIAHLLPNWRHFQLACALSFILYIPYYWVMEESPRWLLSQGRDEEAIAYFKKSARINRVKIPKNIKIYLEYQQKTEGNVLMLFKTPNLRKKSVLVCLLWFSVSIVYFGMTFNVGNIGGNIFVNNYLLQGVGLLQFFGLWYIKLGRRIAISSAFLICCFMCAVIPVFSTFGIQAGVVVMSLIGKLFIAVNFENIYVITAELYPTSARVTALGMGSSVARIGGAISPYLVLSNDLWDKLPYVIFGIIALIAGLFGILVPETMNKTLPDSLQQVENENLLNTPCCSKSPEEDDKSIVTGEAVPTTDV